MPYTKRLLGAGLILAACASCSDSATNSSTTAKPRDGKAGHGQVTLHLPGMNQRLQIL